MKQPKRVTGHLQWFLSVDQGKQLEICSDDEAAPYPLAFIRADERDESLWFVFAATDQLIELPLALIRKAVEVATGEVHSELWYETNAHPKPEAADDLSGEAG